MATIDIWDSWHDEREIHTCGPSQDLLASKLLDRLKPVAGKRILELGCGQGADAVRFARRGAQVIACDLSPIAVDKARTRAAGLDISFHVHDMLSGMPAHRVHAVYSHLGLHYFSPGETARLFAAIAAATLPGGLLAFAVKSVADPYFSQSEPVGDCVFVRTRKGKIRHFFSARYVEALLPGWELLDITEQSDFYQSATVSALLHVVARKPDGAHRVVAGAS